MAKRGYKLQEFMAHAGSVNCVNIGKKTCRLFVTGGDDQKVNVWSIGKPTSLTSLSGHTSPVESIAFDSAETLVVSGASAGTIKLWDLEETKMVRNLTGHRSNCTAVEFHPFGEFFASGSMDTNLKIWDIRKKGCLHTYKGHSRGISTIRFTPDGRWVVSGGFDNVVKVWDLTAGKLLHDFKFHEGHIRSIDFHPLEFLLATGSADRTVKFWDLETFELIGSSRPEATGVRSVAFHPDGRTLFCGSDDSLKVYSWEPVIRHDAVDMGWSTLGDLCINEGKLLGCSYFRNSVGVWVADISLVEPYGESLVPDENSHLEKKYDMPDSPLERVGSHRRSTSSVRCVSPDFDSKEIKNIYIDTAGGKPTSTSKVGSLNSPKVVASIDSTDLSTGATQKQAIAPSLRSKSMGQTNSKLFIVPSVVHRDSPEEKVLYSSGRESVITARTSKGMSLEASHTRRPSNMKLDTDRLLMPVECGLLDNVKGASDKKMDLDMHSRSAEDDNAIEHSSEKLTSMKNVTERLGETLSPMALSSQGGESTDCRREMNSVKIVNGVAIVQGRTRSLVERFEKRENLKSGEVQILNTASPITPEMEKTSLELNGSSLSTTGRELTVPKADDITEDLLANHDVWLSTLRSRLTKLQVVRHYWERNDVKGAINALRKLPDHSVQADFVGILLERMEILNLDLFSCLLPVLLGLLDSETERFAIVSLEMLLKLVAVFGQLVHSAVSAPPGVGVDLHAEQRRELCNQCFIHLQTIQRVLPALIRRGGLVAKSAQELNLVLQEC